MSLLSRCLTTYELEYSSTKAGPFFRINVKDSVFNSFVFAPDPSNVKTGKGANVNLWSILTAGFYTDIFFRVSNTEHTFVPINL